MISLENTPIKSPDIFDEYNNNRCNATKTPTPRILKEDVNKVEALQESIDFLCKQHAAVLNGLYEEIENLRRTNKALQFRLVMCCCSARAENRKAKAVESTCSRTQEDLATEVIDLRQQLDKERSKNETLTQQLEALTSARSVVSDADRVVPKTAPPKGEKVPTGEVLNSGKLEEQTLYPKKPIEKRHVDASETSYRLTHPVQTKPGTGSRILSPELNPDSSSSAILLTPKTKITASEGFWVRPSVATLQNKLWQKGNTSPRQSYLPGTRITPVKLPVLRTSGPMGQTVGEDPGQELSTPTLHITELHQDGPASGETAVRRLSNESHQMKSSQSARGTLGHNSIAIYDTVHSVPKSSKSTALRASHPPYDPQLGPFLPALPKTGDPGHSTRTRKAREIQRKRLNRAQNIYPS